jgi:hypothetical protein
LHPTQELPEWFASDDDFTSAISEKWAISMEENQVVRTLNAVA